MSGAAPIRERRDGGADEARALARANAGGTSGAPETPAYLTRARALGALAILGAILIATAIVALACGSVHISLVAAINDPASADRAILMGVRMPRVLMGAMVGVVVLMLANFVASLFGINMGLRDGGTMAIIFSLVVIGVAAFSLLLDFDQADQAIRAGVPAKYAWYIAFGLMTTLVWLYIEILRLISYLRGD